MTLVITLVNDFVIVRVEFSSLSLACYFNVSDGRRVEVSSQSHACNSHVFDDCRIEVNSQFHACDSHRVKVNSHSHAVGVGTQMLQLEILLASVQT